MYIRTTLLTFLVIITLISCDKNNEELSNGIEDLYGSWIEPDYNDSLITYIRSENLAEDKYGIKFELKSSFIERKNVGWCGTPPITYGDWGGLWQIQDSIIDITVGYWGGTVDYKWKLISVDKNELKIIVLDRVYHEDS